MLEVRSLDSKLLFVLVSWVVMVLKFCVIFLIKGLLFYKRHLMK